MTPLSAPVRVQLAHRAMLHIDGGTRRVECHTGSVWITQDRDVRDIVLEPGEHFTPVPGRHAIAYALDSATLALYGDTPATTRPIARQGHRLSHTMAMG